MLRTITVLIPLLALPACHEPYSDGATPEPGDDPPPLTVVRVVDDGTQVIGARVVFHDAGGSVLATIPTDSHGEAAYPLASGGAVTVAHWRERSDLGDRAQLITTLDVRAGAQLAIEIPRFDDLRAPRDPGPTVGQVDVQFPSVPQAHTYVVHLGCTSITTDLTQLTIDVPQACLGSDGTVDLTVNAYSAPEIAAHLGINFATDIDLADGVPGQANLGTWSSLPLPALDLSLVQAPAGAIHAFAYVQQKSDGLVFPPAIADGAELGDAPVHHLRPGVLDGFTESIDLVTRVHASVDSKTEQLLYDVEVGPITVDGDGLLPLITDVSFDADAREVRWDAATTLAGADGVYLSVRALPPSVRQVRRRWLILAPPDAASPVVLPQLPPELMDHSPEAADVPASAGFAAFEFEWISGPDEFFELGTVIIDDLCIPTGEAQTGRVTRAGAFDGLSLEAVSL